MQDDLPTVGDDRTTRDRDATPRLVHLADTHDLQVADGDPDIRGWNVRTADGEKIGVVSDLIVDRELMTVRYVEAKIDREVLNAGADRHVIVPIASARLDDDTDTVFLHADIVDPRSLAPYDRALLEHADMTMRADQERQFFGQRRGGRDGASYLTPLNDTPRPRNELP